MASNPTIIPSKNFYDTIAPAYDQMLDSPENVGVRKAIAAIFTGAVNAGPVLDFGGGTGLDLPWLAAGYNTVFFLEPSEQMRRVAQHNAQAHSNTVRFLESGLDFAAWTAAALPFRQKVQGVLANFAVVNCIKDIALLFEKLALICPPGGVLVFTVLDTRWKILLKKYPRRVALAFLLGRRNIVYHNFKNVSHETYLHSVTALQKRARPYFEHTGYTPVSNSPFAVITFRKN